MKVATKANVRTANAAKDNSKALEVAFLEVQSWDSVLSV